MGKLVLISTSSNTCSCSLCLASDGTVVTGDSLGHVKFFDARTATLLQTFTAHQADVLCMAISPLGSSVYTSGVDQRTVEFTLISSGTTDTANKVQEKWVITSTRRMHSHDVKALTIEPSQDLLEYARRNGKPSVPNRVPILLSGGIDMTLVMCTAAPPGLNLENLAAASTSRSTIHRNPISSSGILTFADTFQRRLAYVPSSTRGGARVTLCAAKRWLFLRRDTGISIWSVDQAISKVTERQEPLSASLYAQQPAPPINEPQYTKILDMALQCHTSLISSAISHDGTWLAISDLYTTKIYKLEVLDGGVVKPRRVKYLDEVLRASLYSHSKPSSPTTESGSSSLVFSPDSCKLVMCLVASSKVVVLDLAPAEEQTLKQVKVLRVFEQHSVTLHKSTLNGRALAGRVSQDVSRNREDDDDDDASGSSEEENEERPYGPTTTNTSASQICCAAVSSDGQWLVTVDLLRRSHIFNLDALQVS